MLMFMRIVFTLVLVYGIYRSTNFFHNYVPNTVLAMENLSEAILRDTTAASQKYSIFKSFRVFIRAIDDKLMEMDSPEEND